MSACAEDLTGGQTATVAPSCDAGRLRRPEEVQNDLGPLRLRLGSVKISRRKPLTAKSTRRDADLERKAHRPRGGGA